MARINEAVETTIGWRRDQSAASETMPNSNWVFRDFKGVSWSGQITVPLREKASTGKLSYLRVVKADASKEQVLNAKPTAAIAKPTAAIAKPEPLTGHLMPFNCRRNDPVVQTTECALLPPVRRAITVCC